VAEQGCCTEIAINVFGVKTELPLSPNDYCRLIVESVLEYAIFVVDTTGRIVNWNAGAERMVGYKADEIIGQQVACLYPQQEVAAGQPCLDLKRAGETGQLTTRSTRVRKDGSTFLAAISISAIQNGSERPTAFTHVLRELNAGNLADGRFAVGQEQVCMFGDGVRECPGTIVMSQMTQEVRDQARIRHMEAAKVAAENANKAKDEFLAMLSHELRTPLTPALAAATYLAEIADLPQDLSEEVATIRRNIQLEARLIDDLLDFTRLIRGKVELHFEVVDAHRLVHEIVEVVGDEIIEKELDVKISLRAAEHHLWADPVRIRQVFWNLIRNAAKFTPARGHIKIGSENNGDGRFHLEVSDTGVGIEPSEQTKVFTAFEQESRSITREFGGLGLGLTISKSLIDLHRGTISVESAGKNRGATFKVSLEAVHENAIVKDCPLKKGPPAKSLRVLVVEDHDDTRRTIARLLTRCGHKVSSTDHVDSALKLLESKRFDAVVSDIGLPDRSGYELIAMAKQRHPIKGIALSGFGMEEDIRRSYQAGFDHHLTKPINFRDLRAVLSEIAG
jgi:PAS domain S-box-containing protein